MNASARPLSPSEAANLVLAEIVEEVTNKFQAGEGVDVEEYSRAHPELAEQLRQLLPALHVLSDLRRSAGSGDAVVPSAPVAVSAAERGELGDFRIIREIGRGGMGIVYEAEQISLNRRVALKVLPFAAAMDAKQLQRFKNEAQAAAHLHHTNIVPVHAVGCERGVYFYAMQYIEGQTLAAIIHELRQLAGVETSGPLPEADAANAFASDLVSGRWAPIKRSDGVEARSSSDDATGPYLRNCSSPHARTASPSHDPTPPAAVLSSGHSTKSPVFFRTVAQMGIQAAEALEHAHQLGVIHRDIKPANLLVDTGRLWVTDFGLAHCQSQPGLTVSGDLVGTLRYMSPEQALAKRVRVDARTDVYSLGVTLYELVTLQPAYNGRNREELLGQIAFEEPRLPRRWNKAVPVELETIVLKAMAKNPDERYRTAQELADDLRRYLDDKPIKAQRPTLWQRAIKWARRHKTVVRAAAVVLGLAVVASVFISRAHQRTKAEQWMRESVLPNIQRHLHDKDYRAAFELAEIAEKVISGDPTLASLRPEFTSTWSVASDPPGADVYAKPYDQPQEAWKHLGKSPLDHVRLPRGFFRWRVTKDGFTPVEGFRNPVGGRIQFVLDPKDSIPPDMVRISGNAYRENVPDLNDPRALDLEDYLMDRCEVTNRQFKEFVDQRGYEERKYWRHFHDRNSTRVVLPAGSLGLLGSPVSQGLIPAITDLIPGGGDNLFVSWEDAMKRFHDQTSMPGPSVWRSGTYPAGEADYPVRGVSWYEAAAYAEFAGKSLPTVAHWLRASGQQQAGAITALSNFARSGPARVGAYQGLGPFGTLDMAGNVKEWCWNHGEGNKRYVLGGAWDEPAYLFTIRDIASAFDRPPNYGFRCVRLLSQKIPPAAFKGDMPAGDRDLEKETPASDELFQVYKSLYAYDKTPLEARIERREESTDSIHETIAFDAAYGKERVIAHLYRPAKGKPPYQAVVYFPGADHFERQTSFLRENPPSDIAFLVHSGRAVLWPVYKGSFERWVEHDFKNPAWRTFRALQIQWYQDLGRSVDYLQERSDIDHEKIAYYGLSRGAWVGIFVLAVDDRFKAAVLACGGLGRPRTRPPEIDGVNFVSRVRLPVLMMNGPNDPLFPLKTSQQPMYRLLGTPQKDKQHRLYDVPGHAVPLDEAAKDALSWLDKYLGKVD